MPEHGLAEPCTDFEIPFLHKRLNYKRIMAENMELPQGVLSDPKATCDLATMDVVDVEFAIVDVEGQLRPFWMWHRPSLSFLDLLWLQDRSSSFTPGIRLK